MKKTVSIVVICGLLLSIGAVSVFALPDGCINTVNNSIILYGSGNNSLTASLNCTAMEPYIYDQELTVDRYSQSNGTQNTNNYNHFTICQQFVFSIRLVNKTGSDIKISAANPLITVNTSMFTSSYTAPANTGVSLEMLQGNLFNTIYPSTTSAINGRWNSDYVYNGLLIIPDGFTLWSNFVINYIWTEDLTYNSVPTAHSYAFKVDNVLLTRPVPADTDIMNLSYSIPGVEYNLYQVNQDLDLVYSQLVNTYNKTVSIDSHLNTIDSNVQTIIDNWAPQSDQASNVTSETSDVMTTNDTIHNSEAQWYSDNSAALQSVGLSNYQYSQDVTTGFSNISTLFSNLWNSLGSWNTVYTFSMMIGLVMLILRHAPQRRKRSSGGKSDG